MTTHTLDAQKARPRASRSAVAIDARAAWVLLRRDLLKFFTHKTRIAGAVIQPLLFWAVLGGGLAGTFRAADTGGVPYLEYFYPGVLVMMLLFSAIFGTMSVIEDRNEGFLQAVLVAAASRLAIVAGKTGGSAAVALVQTSLFLVFLPWSGFDAAGVQWLSLVGALSLGAVSLTALGFSLAWWLDSTQAYHAIMSVLLIPMWLLSGAMFPASGASPAVAAIVRYNPMSYTVEAIRRALYGGSVPSSIGLGSSAFTEWAVLGGFTAATLAVAVLLCSRRA